MTKLVTPCTTLQETRLEDEELDFSVHQQDPLVLEKNETHRILGTLIQRNVDTIV